VPTCKPAPPCACQAGLHHALAHACATRLATVHVRVVGARPRNTVARIGREHGVSRKAGMPMRHSFLEMQFAVKILKQNYSTVCKALSY
jgi:hypothetical protein